MITEFIVLIPKLRKRNCANIRLTRSNLWGSSHQPLPNEKTTKLFLLQTKDVRARARHVFSAKMSILDWGISAKLLAFCRDSLSRSITFERLKSITCFILTL